MARGAVDKAASDPTWTRPAKHRRTTRDPAGGNAWRWYAIRDSNPEHADNYPGVGSPLDLEVLGYSGTGQLRLRVIT
jgi:hypothetical protein